MVSINDVKIDVPESCVECDIAKVGYYYDDTLVYCPLVKAFFETNIVDDKRHSLCPLKEG